MQKSKSLRLVLDTNLWISYLISIRLIKLDSQIIHPESKLLFSSELLEEIRITITKPKLKRYFTVSSFEEMLMEFEPIIEIVEVTTIVNICRDPKDNFLLSLSKDGNSDYLLTGDKDLLEIKKFGKTQILTVSAFMEKRKQFR